jgi:hypothetical protein
MPAACPPRDPKPWGANPGEARLGWGWGGPGNIGAPGGCWRFGGGMPGLSGPSPLGTRPGEKGVAAS